MYTVQAIGILAMSGHNVGSSGFLSVLLAAGKYASSSFFSVCYVVLIDLLPGLKIAQHLNLHRLGGREPPVDPRDLIQYELGKRVWWSLTSQVRIRLYSS
jgi:hypothetical protein